MTEKHQPDHQVVPEGDETAQYACGHAGLVRYHHLIFGKKFEIRQDFIKRRERCPECLLKYATEGVTRCGVCGDPIFKGADCVIFEGKVCCLKTSCTPGPMCCDVGVWNGERFVDGITAGTVVVLPRDG